ncbi:hypothetical protein V1517DRAFT_321005 [Lipomyces orientalis]|uniref:Uncharacterized protein n=1 Tax=Lipomyces orientalis TaxID=1233043 RepID=A0ACC3TR24_9ASCO
MLICVIVGVISMLPCRSHSCVGRGIVITNISRPASVCCSTAGPQTLNSRSAGPASKSPSWLIRGARALLI